MDELYFTWLCDLVGSVEVGNRKQTYWNLLRQLYKTEFVWLIPNDDNRAEDGRELRLEFIDQKQINVTDDHWMDLGCSVLELIVGISRRLQFEADSEVHIWFWHLIRNLKLDEFSDDYYNEARVEEILLILIYRTYHGSGNGGLFPLQKPVENQRRVELWYQMSAYLLEKGY